jgi:hypothetical protein
MPSHADWTPAFAGESRRGQPSAHPPWVAFATPALCRSRKTTVGAALAPPSPPRKRGSSPELVPRLVCADSWHTLPRRGIGRAIRTRERKGIATGCQLVLAAFVVDRFLSPAHRGRTLRILATREDSGCGDQIHPGGLKDRDRPAQGVALGTVDPQKFCALKGRDIWDSARKSRPFRAQNQFWSQHTQGYALGCAIAVLQTAGRTPHCAGSGPRYKVGPRHAPRSSRRARISKCRSSGWYICATLRRIG